MGLENGGQAPPGALFHWAAETDSGLRVVDVWESREAFDRFAEEQIGRTRRPPGSTARPAMTFHDIHGYVQRLASRAPACAAGPARRSAASRRPRRRAPAPSSPASASLAASPVIERRSLEGGEVGVLVGRGERLALGEQRLEPDPQLQRRLARAAGVEVGAGADQQQLAGGDRARGRRAPRRPAPAGAGPRRAGGARTCGISIASL